MITPPVQFFGNPDSTRNLVFTILTREYPLRIVELTNFIRKRYGKSITFQATRKAALQLVQEGVLERSEHEFQIRKEWVAEGRQLLANLHEHLQHPAAKPTTTQESGTDVNVYTFESVNALMLFWEDLIVRWIAKYRKGDPRINCYQTSHIWEAVLHPDIEQKMMNKLREKGVTSYAVCNSNTALDRATCKFYTRIGVKTVISPSKKAVDRGYTVGTYGELIVQVQYPERVIKEMDAFFKRNATIEDLDVQELVKIVNRREPIKLTVIRNLAMAEQINKSIMALIL